MVLTCPLRVTNFKKIREQITHCIDKWLESKTVAICKSQESILLRQEKRCASVPGKDL